MSGVLVVDNGAWEVKAGKASSEEAAVSVPNCCSKGGKRVKRSVVVGDATRQLRESGTVYRRPQERGFVVDWQLQKAVWDSMFVDARLQPCSELLLSLSPFTPRALLQDAAQVCFEQYDFDSCTAVTGQLLMARDPLLQRSSNCFVSLDVGYSHGYVVPCVDGVAHVEAVGRLDVAGKALTNLLKETIHYRQWNMLDETWLANHLKERLIYVAEDFERELASFRDPHYPHHREYVLPDYVTSKTGWIKGVDEAPPVPTDADYVHDPQILRMGVERISVSECLFRPSDMGLPQMGVAEGLLYCLNKLPQHVVPSVTQNIILGGGCFNIPGFVQRLTNEIRSKLPSDYEVTLTCPEKPEQCIWRGCAKFAKEPLYQQVKSTRSDYYEFGADLLEKKGRKYNLLF